MLGNQSYTGITNLANQVPVLNATEITAVDVDGDTADFVTSTHGALAVTTQVTGTVTFDATRNLYPVFYKGGARSRNPDGSLVEPPTFARTPIIFPENTQLLSCRYLSPDRGITPIAGVPLGFSIGCGDPDTVLVAGTTMVVGSALSVFVANTLQGGYVQGTVTIGTPQIFGGSGDPAAPNTLAQIVTPAPFNQLLVQDMAASPLLLGTLEVTIEFVVWREAFGIRNNGFLNGTLVQGETII